MSSIYYKIKQEKLILAIAVTIWLFLLLTTISKSYAYVTRNGLDLDLGFLIIRAFLMWAVIALFTPLWIKLGRWLFSKDSTLIIFGTHILTSILIVPVYAVVYRLLMIFFWYDTTWDLAYIFDAIPTIMSSYGIIGPLSYWLTIGAYYLKKYYDQYKERQVKNMEMQAELASIRLHVLKVQLHPHFLFNTLHNINSLIYEEPETAKRLLNLLKRFLSISIKRVNQQLVPLMDELEFTGTYLAIEKTRFSNRLSIETNIEDDTLEALVPSFILQPLVENAVKHGISKRMQAGILKITSKRDGDFLNLFVEDNGPGLNGKFNEQGIGLENIRQRLNQLYSQNSFDLSTSQLGGLKVEIHIPFTTKQTNAVAHNG